MINNTIEFPIWKQGDEWPPLGLLIIAGIFSISAAGIVSSETGSAETMLQILQNDKIFPNPSKEEKDLTPEEINYLMTRENFIAKLKQALSSLDDLPHQLL